MKHTVLSVVTTVLAIVVAASSMSAQSLSAAYDSSRQVKLQGPVTRIDWVNPHAYLFLDVKDATGTITNWAVEFGNPLELEKDGWKRSALHIGDVVTVEGILARTESRRAQAKSVVLTRTAKRLFAPAPRRAAALAAPAPRWPDGQIRLGPPAGKKGYWGTPSSKVLVDKSAGNIPMSDDGLLINLADADKVAPL